MQKNRPRTRAGFIFGSFLLVVLSFIACQHPNSAPAPPIAVAPSLTWKIPGVGSLYVETHYHGTVGANQQGSSDAHYFVSTVGSFANKPNTIKLDSIEEYIAYESNGDYSILDSSWGYSSADWQTYPTGGGLPSCRLSIRPTLQMAFFF
jgi:hypothetical protein